MKARYSVLLIVLLLTACATKPEVGGPYAARISAADLEEIRVAGSAEFHTGHLIKVKVIRPDCTWVTASSKCPYDFGHTFFVVRRHGHWIVQTEMLPHVPSNQAMQPTPKVFASRRASPRTASLTVTNTHSFQASLAATWISSKTPASLVRFASSRSRTPAVLLFNGSDD
jgi:hypothetical protein